MTDTYCMLLLSVNSLCVFIMPQSMFYSRVFWETLRNPDGRGFSRKFLTRMQITAKYDWPEILYILHLKVPSGLMGSAWEWYHWIGLGKRHQPLQVFDFLILILNSEPHHTKMHLILLLVGIMGWWSQTRLQKCGKVNNWSLDYGLWEEYSKNL
jgi:hypothetical protein